MIKLTSKRSADHLRSLSETGMGYSIVTAHMKDGRIFNQLVMDSGYIIKVRGYRDIPFTEAGIDKFVVTHDKWESCR